MWFLRFFYFKDADAINRVGTGIKKSATMGGFFYDEQKLF